MLYILLIIIAIGVLLISKAGQGLLKLFGWIVAIAGVLFLVFLIITGGVVLISSNWESIKEVLLSIVAVIGMCIFWVLIIMLFGKKNKITEPVIKKDEYTFQESQDRGKLGVMYNSDKEEIRSAYIKLIKKYNPHGSTEDGKKFIEIRDAYDRLTKKD